MPFTYLVDGRWIGHYPVGWPVLLAVGLAVFLLVESACGADPGGGGRAMSYFTGAIDEVRLYDRALSPAEIGSLARAQ